MRREALPRVPEDVMPLRSTVVAVTDSDYRLTEGPVWIAADGCLLFTDVPRGVIHRLDRDGRVSEARRASGHANGLTLDARGRLVACESGNRRVTRAEPDGTLTVLAGGREGLPLNAPNDVVVSRAGNVYCTGPFGIWVLSPAGELLGVIEIPPAYGHARNLAWGGPDWTSLFVCAGSASEQRALVYRVELVVRGTGCHIPAHHRLAGGGRRRCLGPGSAEVGEGLRPQRGGIHPKQHAGVGAPEPDRAVAVGNAPDRSR